MLITNWSTMETFPRGSCCSNGLRQDDALPSAACLRRNAFGTLTRPHVLIIRYLGTLTPKCDEFVGLYISGYNIPKMRSSQCGAMFRLQASGLEAKIEPHLSQGTVVVTVLVAPVFALVLRHYHVKIWEECII